jgi:hypothetical protein
MVGLGKVKGGQKSDDEKEIKKEEKRKEKRKKVGRWYGDGEDGEDR